MSLTDWVNKPTETTDREVVVTEHNALQLLVIKDNA